MSMGVLASSQVAHECLTPVLLDVYFILWNQYLIRTFHGLQIGTELDMLTLANLADKVETWELALGVGSDDQQSSKCMPISCLRRDVFDVGFPYTPSELVCEC